MERVIRARAKAVVEVVMVDEGGGGWGEVEEEMRIVE